MKVLIGYDGSTGSLVAVDDLVRAGLPDDGEAVVLTAFDYCLPALAVGPIAAPCAVAIAEREDTGTSLKEKTERAAAISMAGVERFRRLYPRWQIQSETSPYSPNSALLARANSFKADLLVVGSEGHSMVSRLLFGSVAQNVLHHAQCTVRIGRGRSASAKSNPSQNEPVRIVLGTDGSHGSELATKAIAARHWPPDSAVWVIAATFQTPFELTASDDPYLSLSAVAARQENRSHYEQAANRQAQYLRDKGLAAIAIVHDMSARHALLKEAEQWAADCIFVGARGLSRIEQMVLGSVSNSIAARAHCSVEVVR